MSRGKPYSLYSRKRKTLKPVWYARFKDEKGCFGAGINTGCTLKRDAEVWSIKYLRKHGIEDIEGVYSFKDENITFQEFSRDFFDWNNTWATDKRARGLRISPYHCKQRTDLLNNHINPIIGKLKLTAVDRAVIKNFRNRMFREEYSGTTINNCLSAIKTILEAAEEEGVIQYVPRIDRAAETPKKKGILTPEEVKRLFSFDWMSDATFRHPAKPLFIEQAGNLLAVTTGLRLGELQGLKHENINLTKNYITVNQSWNNALHCLNEKTKTGKERRIFFSDMVKEKIIQLVNDNPHGQNPDSFLFYSEFQDKPKDKRAFSVSLFTALEQIGIDAEARKERNITFHSHRHFLNSLLINARIPIQKVQSITGHTSMEMTEHYYRVDEMSDVLKLTDGLFTIQ